MTVKELQDKIVKLKKELGVCILAHSYQAREICEVADIVGDSYALSVKAKDVPQDKVIMCGVRFMAQTVKMLSPEKTVILSSPVAGCPMADMIEKDTILQLKERFPDYTVVAYVNTTAETKTVCDVCVTSSSADRIVKKIDNDKILFVPDCNLGAYIRDMIPEKTFQLYSGGCPTHARIGREHVLEAKERHPGALVLVHPECQPEVVKLADYVGSTSGIMDYAKASDAKEFIIGTEVSIAEHLQYDCPDKKFYPLSKALVCQNMKATTLMDVYNCLLGEAGEEITMDQQTIADARKCIDKMIELGG